MQFPQGMKPMKQTCLERKRKDITAMARDARALELTTDSHDAVATRYDKYAENHLASVKLAAIRIWMRFNESVT